MQTVKIVLLCIGELVMLCTIIYLGWKFLTLCDTVEEKSKPGGYQTDKIKNPHHPYAPDPNQ